MPRTDAAARSVAAPPDRTFAALVDPAAMLAWLPPRGMTGRFEHADLRPGGSYRLVLTYAEDSAAAKTTDDSDVVDVRIVELEPGRRVVQAVDFVADHPALRGTMTMTWAVEPLAVGSRITITADDVPEGIDPVDHAEGLESSLAQLAAHVDGGPTIAFAPVRMPADADAVVRFLSEHPWPFHGVAAPTVAQAAAVELASDDVASFWLTVDGQAVGLARLLDLSDIGAGAPQFDLRIQPSSRGRGLGTIATRWIADRLFTEHPALHRIEAATRADNVGMQRALAAGGFQLEGQLRQSWSDGAGRWHDTLVFGILRTEWRPPA